MPTVVAKKRKAKVQLSAELSAELGVSGVIVSRKKLTTAQKKFVRERRKAVQQNAAKIRTIAAHRDKAEAIKAKKAERKRVLMSLSSSALSSQEMGLMQSSKMLRSGNASLTRKQMMSRALKRERAGLQLNAQDNRSLFTPITHPENSRDIDDDDDDDDDETSKAIDYSSTLDRVVNIVRVSNRARHKRKVLIDVTASSTVSSCDATTQSAKVSSSSLKNVEQPNVSEITPSLCQSHETVSPEIEVERDSMSSETDDDDDDDDDDDKHIDDDTVVEPLADMKLNHRAFVVHVTRDATIDSMRRQLPVVAEEHTIMNTINSHGVSLICAATGSGKTTQVPQFLYEAGYAHGRGRCRRQEGDKLSVEHGIIGVTQPRRVAAVSTAQRVALELGHEHGESVAHQVRFDSSTSAKTRIKFMTDGVLLRELHHDVLLRKYSVIVLDEAHERNLITDLLIGLLSRIVPLRNHRAHTDETLAPLRIVIMSATLRIEDFTSNTKLFPLTPPVVKVASRQHEVSIHFSRRTELEDYVKTAFDKVCRVHTELPEGAILVFLTGRMEIRRMCSLLMARFNACNENAERKQNYDNDVCDDDEDERGNLPTGRDMVEVDADDEEEAQCADTASINHENVLANNECDSAEVSDRALAGAVRIVPLYALLSKREQMRVFESVPDGTRLIVVSTNVAETSLTIPGVRYVVDSGREKARVFDARTGASQFIVQWISKASADQRAGRAGRTGPGHSYRLYSSAVYNERFPEFTDPEILRLPIDGVVLHMKSMGIDHIDTFPFPTRPDPEALHTAIQTLTRLGALEVVAPGSLKPASITALGKTMSSFPLAPRFAKMLALADQGGCLPYAVCIIAALTVDNLFANDVAENEVALEKDIADQLLKQRQRVASARIKLIDRESDLLTMLTVVCSFDFNAASSADGGSGGDPLEFCRHFSLRAKSLFEVRALRQQLHRVVDRLRNTHQSSFCALLQPPSNEQRVLLVQIITSALVDRVARRWPLDHPLPSNMPPNLARAAYQCCNNPLQPVFIHPSSVLFAPKHQPDFLVYRELVHSSRAYMRGITRISPHHLFRLAPTLCDVSAPLDEPAPYFDMDSDTMLAYVNVRFGRGRWSLPMQIQPLKCSEKGLLWFARRFLEGEVVSPIARLRTMLRVRPSTLTQNLQTNKLVRPFLHCLSLSKVQKRAELFSQWRKSSRFLYDELQTLVQPTAHNLLDEVWTECLALVDSNSI